MMDRNHTSTIYKTFHTSIYPIHTNISHACIHTSSHRYLPVSSDVLERVTVGKISPTSLAGKLVGELGRFPAFRIAHDSWDCATHRV